MGRKINLDFSVDAIKKESFERGKRVSQKEFNKMLNEIRAEIENEFVDYAYEEDASYNSGLNKAIEIIDKYKGRK